MKRLFLILVLVFPGLVMAKDKKTHDRIVNFSGTLQNVVLVRTDSDFDRTRPYYNAEGQGVGAIATIFDPTVKVNIRDGLFVFYQAELGLNYWSKNNPDQQNATAGDVFVLKHRQVFVQGLLLDKTFEFKVGYQYLSDPTGLFVSHWIGAAKLGWRGRNHAVGVLFTQFPDSQWEGVTVDKNNFKHDTFLGGIYYRGGFGDWRIRAWATVFYDAHIIDKALILGVPSLNVGWHSRNTGIAISGIVQAGIQRHGAFDLSDARFFSWAVQVNAWWKYKGLRITANLFGLGADDGTKGNGLRGGFLYGGKNRSATVYMTEDEVRDWYDNRDELIGIREGAFFSMRPGLVVGDLKFDYRFLDWLAIRGIVGSAMVVNPDNAMGGRYVGTEGDLQVWFGRAPLFASVTVGAMGPGKAGAVLINAMDRTALDPVIYVEASLDVRF